MRVAWTSRIDQWRGLRVAACGHYKIKHGFLGAWQTADQPVVDVSDGTLLYGRGQVFQACSDVGLQLTQA